MTDDPRNLDSVLDEGRFPSLCRLVAPLDAPARARVFLEIELLKALVRAETWTEAAAVAMDPETMLQRAGTQRRVAVLLAMDDDGGPPREAGRRTPPVARPGTFVWRGKVRPL